MSEPSVESREDRIARALRYARMVIEGYQSEIRNSAWTGVDLTAAGFCQGEIYRDALADIAAIERGERTDGFVEPPANGRASVGRHEEGV